MPDRAASLAPRLGPGLVLASVALACAGAAPRPAPGIAEASPASAALLARWVEPLDALAPEEWVALEGRGALGPVAGELDAWRRRLLRPEAVPAWGDGMRLSARGAAGGLPDVVRTDSETAVMRLEVLDTRSFMLVRVGDPGVDVADGAAALVIVRRVLAVGPDRAWTVALPARLAEGVWYTSNARVDAGAAESWRDRIDVRVRAGRLELLCYKASEGGDPAGWFDGALRARLGRGRVAP